MVHTEHSPDIVQAQRDWIRTYNSLAEAPTGSNTRLRRCRSICPAVSSRTSLGSS
ncbi:hypothetical protein ACFQ0Q_05710 [Streptomyces aureus]